VIARSIKLLARTDFVLTKQIRLQLIRAFAEVRRELKDMKLRWPRAETPTHFITMGLHESLDEAAPRHQGNDRLSDD
jgi:hypothetical protein